MPNDSARAPGNAWKNGFFSISHTAPADAYQRTLPIFEAVVKSFQPKS